MPDLNSVPPSPHILAASRRVSSNQNVNQNTQSQAPPPSSSLDSSSSINILPSNQQTVNQGLPAATASLPSPIPPTSGMAPPQVAAGQDNTGVGAGPGPLRHPRPLTAAELHSQLEQEQELLVRCVSTSCSFPYSFPWHIYIPYYDSGKSFSASIIRVRTMWLVIGTA